MAVLSLAQRPMMSPTWLTWLLILSLLVSPSQSWLSPLKAATRVPHPQDDTTTLSTTASFMSSSKKKDTETTTTTQDSDFLENLQGAATQLGQDLFRTLRWGAANALTETLPEPQRQALLGRLDNNTTTKMVDEGILTNSVNEAVAAALAEEAQKETERWERERQQILVQANAAAEQRVATELKIQEQRLLNNSSANEYAHAVLGPVVVDLGYKRVHLASAATLASIPVWKRQRVYRHDRAKTMAGDKRKTMHLGLPGIICLHEQTNGKLSILDGQHRVGMMKLLLERNETTSFDLENILVEVYPEDPNIRSNDHAQDIFLEVNKAEPIKLVDMPGVATAKDRTMILKAVSKLEDKYPAMFSPSQRCRVPNVNSDNLRDQIFAANIIKRYDMKSFTKLYEFLEMQNTELATKYATDAHSVSEKAIGKARSNQFFLGCESSWLYN